MGLRVPTNVRPGSLESPIPLEDERQQLAAQAEPLQGEFPQQDIAPIAEPALQEPQQDLSQFAQPEPPVEEPGLARFKQVRPSSLQPPPGKSAEDSDEVRARSIDTLSDEFALEVPTSQRVEQEESGQEDTDDVIRRIDRLMDQPASDDQRQQLRMQLRRAKKLGLSKDDIESRLTQPEIEAPSFGDRVRNTIKDAGARFRAGLGRNDAEVRKAIVSSFGEENVEMRGGEFFVRKSAKEEFRQLDPGGFGLDLILDVFADFSGPIIEGAVALPIEAAGAVGGFIGGGPVGAVAGAIGAGAVGGAAGASVREGVIQGIDLIADETQRADDVDFGDELMWGAGISAAVPGGAGVIKAGLKTAAKFSILGRGVSILKDFIGKPKRLAKEFFELNDQLTKVLEDAGSKGVGLEDVASKTHGTLTDVQDSLGQGVGAVRNSVRQLAGDEKFDTELMLTKMREHLDDNFAVRDPNTGVYSLPESEVIEQTVISPEGLEEVAQIIPRAETRAVLGTKAGSRQLREVLNDYNSLLSAEKIEGGVDVKTIENFLSKYDELSKLDIDPSTKRLFNTQERNMYSSIRGAGTSDRNKVFDQVLSRDPNSEASKLWKQDIFATYTNTIDDLRDLRKMIGSEKGARAISKIMKPDNVNQVKKLKRVLGESSQEWESLRGEWLARSVEESKDTVSGIFDGRKFLDKMGKFDKQTLNELVEPELMGRLTAISKRFADVPFADLTKEPGSKQLVSDVAALTMSRQLFPQTKIRIIMRLFGPNVENIDHIMKSGLESVEKVPTQAKKNSLMQGLRDMRQFVSRMRKVPVSRKNAKGVVEETSIYVPVGKRAISQAAIGFRREALDRGEAAPSGQPQLAPILQ